MKDKSFLFEGWYFKHTNNKSTLCIIPGICPNEGIAFIQIINNQFSYMYQFSANKFKSGKKDFFIRADNCIFSKKGMEIDIRNCDLQISGRINYGKTTPLKVTTYAPNIMGPFSYFNFMECYHDVISMSHSLQGSVSINGKRHVFDGGKGYIERDYGNSFPQRYVWLQSHDFKNMTSLMVSIANIPMKGFSFVGLLCVLVANGKEYNFSTYYGGKIKGFRIDSKHMEVVIIKDGYVLLLNIVIDSAPMALKSPQMGIMSRTINESVSNTVFVKLYKDGALILKDKGINVGFEVVLK